MTAGGGTVFLVGGINDRGFVTGGWRVGFRWAGLPHEVVHFRWQQGWRAVLTFADLWRTGHHRRKAAELAEHIRAVQRAKPGRPVHVVAHSAGTAVTAYALELLGEDEAITSAVFVGSGLSARFDLSAALARCRFGLLSVESWLDWFFLGLGTSLLGSADRRFGPAAGMVGFRASGADRVRTIRWHPRLVRQGWVGGHLAQGSPWFARDTLAGWVREADAAVG